VLQALKRLLMSRPYENPDQLTLPLSPPPQPLRSADDLLMRLRALGLQRIDRCRLTRNRNVMVSFGGGELRVHEGYLSAPDDVLQAIVAFVGGRTRPERRSAQRTIIAHPVRSPTPPRRREHTHADDIGIAEELTQWHARYNADHFQGRLTGVAIRVSRRMRSRLGHYTAAANGEPAEIAMSRRHVRRHGWEEALHTLLHEMVHQWQDEAGHTIDHGATFRAKAREVGIAPHARRTLAKQASHRTGAQTIGTRAAREG
jgi:hypothetical protein